MALTPELVRALARLHAGTAWAATAALAVAPFASRWGLAGAPRARAALAGAAGSLLSIASALGVALDEPFRTRLRQKLFLASPTLGWWFERKQHLAYAALLFGVTWLAARRLAARSPTARPELAQTAQMAWLFTAGCALAASIISLLVARRMRF